MFVEQAEEHTYLYLNDCKFRYNKLEEGEFNKISQAIEEGNFGYAVMLINAKSKLDCSLKEANKIVSKMIKFVNDNLHLKESEGKKVLVEDWSRDFSRKTYKKAVIKNLKLAENGNVVAAIKDGSKSYLVEYKTNSRLASKVLGSFEYLGESYSRMILSDLVNVASTYHVTTRFDEAQNIGPGVYAITDIKAEEPDKLLITFVDAASGKEYKNTATVDLEVIKEDNYESLQAFVDSLNEEVDHLKFEDDLELAVESSADLLSEISGYLKPGIGFGQRISTGNKNTTYSDTAALAQDKKDASGNKVTRKYVPVDLWYVVQQGTQAQKGLQDGKYIKIDDQIVDNYRVKVYLLDQEGNAYVCAYEMKPNLREILSLEEWFNELLEEMPDVTPEQITFDEAYEKTRPFVKQLAQDAVRGDIKKANDFDSGKWKVQEDAGCLQATDVPEKIDYKDELQVPTISESSELVLEAWLVDLVARGFEPDSEGYLTRGGKYLVRENNSLVIKHHSELWEQDGSPIDDTLDIVSILD